MSSLVRIGSVVAVALATAIAGACSDDHDDEHEEEGTPTGATCPSGSTLTYESFAQPFFDEYCTRCHSSELTGDARQDAPLGHDFDTEEGALFVGEHIDEYAAAGPDAVNEIMPPDGAKPTEEERRQLGEWLACALGKTEDAGTDAAAGDGGDAAQ